MTKCFDVDMLVCDEAIIISSLARKYKKGIISQDELYKMIKDRLVKTILALGDGIPQEDDNKDVYEWKLIRTKKAPTSPPTQSPQQ